MNPEEDARLKDYLGHILIAIDRINQYLDEMNETAFAQDQRTQDAVIRNFEIIGEASRNITKHYSDYAAKNSHVPWDIAYEMRNVLAHGYFGVDIGIVWKTIENDLPILKAQITALLQTTS